jgi:hypothetical protein
LAQLVPRLALLPLLLLAAPAAAAVKACLLSF